jgi:hypothetical protein
VAETHSDQAAQDRAKITEQQKENAKKKIAEQQQAREAATRDAPEAGKPTPTQEENDMAAMGVHVIDHEPDGSPVQDPNAPLGQQQHQTRQVEARKPAQSGQSGQAGTYNTRQQTPNKPAADQS